MVRVRAHAAVCSEPSGKAGRLANPHGWPSRKAIHIYSWLHHILSYRCPQRRPRTPITPKHARNMGLEVNSNRSHIYSLLCHPLILMTPLFFTYVTQHSPCCSGSELNAVRDWDKSLCRHTWGVQIKRYHSLLLVEVYARTVSDGYKGNYGLRFHSWATLLVACCLLIQCHCRSLLIFLTCCIIVMQTWDKNN